MTKVSKGILLDTFMQHFSVELALSSVQKQEIYRIRYRVYCKEFKFESVEQFPDRQESDEYDSVARHCLIRHRRTGQPAGCVRLVPATEMLLPVEKYCASVLDRERVEPWLEDRNRLCELSRLAVDSAFRQRDGESLSRVGDVLPIKFTPQEIRSCSLISVALILTGVALTEKEQRPNIFAVMEPFMPRMMDRVGIRFQRVGKEIDYHGIRAPYCITTQLMLDGMLPEYRDLYQWIRESLDA